jgi:CHAT domain-containing protein
MQHLFAGGIDRDFQLLREAGRAAQEGRTDDSVRLFRTGLKGMERLFELAEISTQTQEGKVSTQYAQPVVAHVMAQEAAFTLSLAVANPKHRGAVDLAVGIAATRMERSQRGERDFSAAVWARELSSEQYRALRSQRSELSWLEFARAAGVRFQRDPRARVAQLRDSIRAARRQLGARVEPDRQRRDVLDFEQVVPVLHRALTPNQRLLMYVRYQPFDLSPATERGSAAPRYAALVVGSEPQRVAVFDLGPASEIEHAASAFIEGIHTRTAHRAKSAAQPLYRLLIEKLLPLLPNGVELKLALDGPLHLIPFAALHDGQSWLIDRYSVTYLTSAQDLLARPASTRSGAAILFGDANYEPYARHLLAGSQRPLPTTPLPGTKAEAEAIKALLPNAELVMGNAATKQRLLGVHSPRILHVASHGIFLDDRAGGGVDPLMRSALILTPLGDRDGLVTAYEVEGLDLSGTQLAVLSACETGLGKVPTHEGVSGFRRSFFVAGVETLVSSLWLVSDVSAKELMVNYYGRLAVGEGRVSAMTAAMRELKTQYTAPYDWAAFIVLGSDAPLRQN